MKLGKIREILMILSLYGDFDRNTIVLEN